MPTDTAYASISRYFDYEIIEPARATTIARKISAVNPDCKGDGITNFEKYVMTELGNAKIAYEMPGADAANRDAIKLSKSTVDIPVLYEDYDIPNNIMKAWLNKSKPIDPAVAKSAAQVVNVKLDSLVLDGWKPNGSTYEINGFYQGAGNDYSTSKDFGTYGNASDAVAGAMALIDADSCTAEAYNLILHPTQFNELKKSRSTNGVREMPEVVEMLNGDKPTGPGRVFNSNTITAGTGLLIPVDVARTYHELVIPVEMRNYLGYDSKVGPDNSPGYGRTYMVAYPHIKLANGLSKLSSI